MTQYKQKINKQGEYLPFYGYTLISMLKEDTSAANSTAAPLLEFQDGSTLEQNSVTAPLFQDGSTLPTLEQIEAFIRASTIGKYYSPLPHSTYHMTLFNIYAMSSEPIPPVRRWMEATKEPLPETLWLEEDVLQVQHIKAGDVIRKLPSQFKIKNLKFYYKGGLGLWITLDKNSDKALSEARKELSAIYEHEDKNLKYHVTFAYLYNDLPQENPDKDELQKDLVKLIELLQPLKNYIFTNHNIYLYNSMTNYLPIDFFFSSSIP
jgi:hypothetical protein